MEYKDWLADIEIAKNEIRNRKMYPDSIVADYYCIPSHNHHAYYVILSKNKNGHSITYLKALIYEIEFDLPIKMYPFSWCKKAEKHPAKQVQFIIGTKRISKNCAEKVLQIIDMLPDDYAPANDCLCIDGVTQGIRLFGDNPKEVFYHDAKKITGLSPAQSAIFDSLYLEIEKLIEC